MAGATILAALATTVASCKHPEVAKSRVADFASAGSTLPGTRSQSVKELILETNNESTFQRKLDLVRTAQKSIDLIYYIWTDDYSASAFMVELYNRVKATNGAVKVRILLDANNHNYKGFNKLKGLKAAVAAAGFPDSVQVALFRQPPSDIMKVMETFDVIQDAQATGEVNYAAMLNPILEEFFPLKDDGTLDQSKLGAIELALINQLRGFYQMILSGSITKDKILTTVLSSALGHAVTTDSLNSVMDMTKRTHHKLLLVDGRTVNGGGRNMWDHSHINQGDPLRAGGDDTHTDSDVDYYVNDETLAAAALATFNGYWDCVDNASCKAGVAINSLQPDPDDVQAQSWQQCLDSAAKYTKKANNSETYPVLYKETFVAHNVPITYVENTMFLLGPGESNPSGRPEKVSSFLSAWVQLIQQYAAESPDDRAQTGNQIILQSAYMVMPTEMLTAVIGAIKNDVKITFISNASNITDNRMVALLTRMQMEAVLTYAKSIGKQDNIVYIENRSGEQMHTKVSIVGNYAIVGSANADPRSAYLNTENGIIIAPGGDVTVSTKPQGARYLDTGNGLKVAQADEISPTDQVADQSADQQPTADQQQMALDDGAAAASSSGTSVADAYAKLLTDQIARYSQQQVPDHTGTMNPVFVQVSLADVKTLLAQPPPGSPTAVALKVKVFNTLRNMFATSMRDGASGALQKKLLYEEILPQF